MKVLEEAIGYKRDEPNNANKIEVKNKLKCK